MLVLLMLMERIIHATVRETEALQIGHEHQLCLTFKIINGLILKLSGVWRPKDTAMFTFNSLKPYVTS